MLLSLMLACTAPDEASGRPPGDAADDTPRPDDEVGDGGESLQLDVSGTLSPTVFAAAVAGPAGATGTIEYGVGDAFDHAIPLTGGEDGQYAAALLGIAGGEDWTVRARIESAAGVEYSPSVDLPHAEVPDWLPELAVAKGDLAPSGGFRLVSCTSPGLGLVGIVDSAGRYVWWASGSEGPGTMTTSARISPDGKAVDWLEVGIPQSTETLHRTQLDKSGQIDVPVPGAHHDFLAIDDDTWAVLVKDVREVDGVSVVGDALVEVEVDGSSRVVWSAWDTFAVDVDDLESGDESGLWWTHANSLAYDGQRYWISLYQLNAVAVVDRLDGALVAQLGGEDSTAGIEGQAFSHQHSPVLSGGMLTVFDNSDPTRSPTVSAAREYAVDADLGGLHEVWRYENPEGAFAANFGNAVRYPDGSAFVSWGNLATLDELDADGALVWRVHATDGTTFGYAQRVEQLGGATW